MKTIFRNIRTASLALCAALTVSSCESFLETDPYDFVAPETFYSNEKECTMALAGVYWTMASENVYGNRYSCMISNIDDLSYYQRNAGALSSQVFGNDHNPSNTDIWNCWKSLYSGINNANILIEKVDDASMDDDVKKRIKGEAKFLRAYYHFLLVQGWYEVPLRKEVFQDVNDSPLEATSHQEAIDWIIQEMEECVDMVDDTQYTLSPSHVKKNTVMGILARVYLWRAGYPINGGTEDYKKAAEWAGKVVATNQHRLNPDLYAMWKCMATDKYDTEYNESMWEVEFIGNREGDGQGIYTDGRIGNVIGNLQKCTANPGKGYSYAFYAPTLILWDLYSDTDKRRDVYIAPYQINNKDVEVAWKDNQIVQRSCGKFRREWETSSMKHKNYTPENYPVLRYSDVLLMQAEAENEANNGPTDKAYKAINTVRERAGLEALKNMDYATFQQEVRDERARELCFESLRKYDLVRWGIYVDAIHNKLGAATATKRWAPGNNFLGAAAYANNTTEKHQFLPIPSRELSVNTKLQQNKFWK